MGRGKTIQIFLPDGSPSGIKLAEITSSIEKAILIPRNKLKEAANREETKQVGIYFLFGVNENKSKPLVYIGETKKGISRIKSHDQNKDFWNYALLIISKTKSFTKTHIEYLEDLTIRMAKEANRFEFENSVSPKTYNIPEHLEADLLDSYDTIKVLTTTLGFPLFEKAEKTKDVFYIKGKGVIAEGNITNEGFVVFKGSQVTKENVPSFSLRLIKQKQNLIEDNILVIDGEIYIFTEDYLFSSCSTAGAIILGINTNGWTKWVNNSGKTLDEVYRK
jgi:hypothetical protein